MEKRFINKIADELRINPKKVEATAELLTEGATIPFISRYRKEVTGSLDEVEITNIRDRFIQLQDLEKRREAILKSLEDQKKLTDELKQKIDKTETMAVLEDIYLPFRPKRRTKATIAKEKGLDPLAQIIFRQKDEVVPLTEAGPFVDEEKGVESTEDALAGARDIMAEWINEDQETRTRMRAYFSNKGLFISKVFKDKETEGAKYRDYFDWQEPVAKAPSHRILAMRRGEKEGILNLLVDPPDEEKVYAIIDDHFVKGNSLSSEQVKTAAHDCYRRLLSHSMETEIRLETKKRADDEAIKVFGNNVRELLLAPPLGQKCIIAIDPGFRTGCKLVCLDPQSKLIHVDKIFPLLSAKAKSESGQKIMELCKKFPVEAIAIGNGTGGRETEAFILELPLSPQIQVVMVNESGASIYSASATAREEFPDQDVTVRGAVSIGRRLMDPLAELVKIDPKSIGVGQYQHDVDQKALGSRLDDIVMSCVNAVGVEVNTASAQLLTYVSGLGPQLAKNILAYRDENGPFPSRVELKKVPRLGAKAFEQAAGFLRIQGGNNALDASAVHPESYYIVKAMAKNLNCSVDELIKDEEKRKTIKKQDYVSDKVGLPTLNDILEELKKPGRDPRKNFESFAFSEDVQKMDDLEIGMKLPGIVTNVTAFGAFVDIGVHQDGLVHISKLADHYVKDPNDEIKVHQKVLVTVMDIDLTRKRISLSMRNENTQGKAKKPSSRKGPVKKATQNMKKSADKSFNNPFAKALKGR